jgi:hypothetical protein
LRPSPPSALFTRPRGSRFNWSFSMDARAERFLLVIPPEQAAAEQASVPITVIVNWTANLQRK